MPFYSKVYESVPQVHWGQTSLLAQAGLLTVIGSAEIAVGQLAKCRASRHGRAPRLLTLALILFLSGCLQRQAEPATAALPLNENLPTSWTPLGDVQGVNIDGDAPTEYLLFFTYDSNNGPVGAVIYNTETADNSTDNEGASSRLSTSFIPYSILPSYRPGTGQGFIAEPAQRNAIGVYSVTFQPAAATNSTEQALPSADALAILGGNSYLTWVWWQAQQDSYGVTQLYSPGNFEAALFQPFNWAGWQDAPVPIREIIAVHPLHDRSLICRRQRYVLVSPTNEALSAGAPIDRIEYRAVDLGLNFCNGAPITPFYPEAVVLTYLLNGETTLWDQQMLDATTIANFELLVARTDILRIDDLASYKTIPGTGTQGSGSTPIAAARTTVCAQILLPVGFADANTPKVALPDVMADNTTATDEAGQPLYSRRWLLFTLRHEQPHREPATPDQLYLTNVEVLPVPETGVAVDCRQWLEG